jgi:hypothetical protein
MTQDEQQQVNAMMRFYEAQVANLTREGAQAAGIAESLAIQLKAAQEKVKELTPKDNVVAIKEPA